MTQEEVLEGNKLIAEFMGVKIGIDKYSWRIGCTEPLQEKHLSYHKEWGWIMPVLEKISRIKIEWKNSQDIDFYYPRTFGMISQENGQIMVRFNGCALYKADTLLEATYLAVVDFVKNYEVPLK